VLGYTNNALTPAQRAVAVDAVLAHAAAGRLAVEHEVLPMSRVAEAWGRTARGGVRQVLSSAGQVAHQDERAGDQGAALG
jgi:hypothetical protein